MNVFAGVFLQVQTRDIHSHRLPVMSVAGLIAIGGHNFENAIRREGLIVLRDLITLGQVRIKIVFASEDRTLVDVKPERQRRARTEFNRPPVQNG